MPNLTNMQKVIRTQILNASESGVFLAALTSFVVRSNFVFLKADRTGISMRSIFQMLG
jgi:hypothetical protein